MTREIAPLVADALNPEDRARREAARRKLADLSMDASGAATFQAILTTILGGAYLVGYRQGGADTTKAERA